ncbi:MAG: aspartyl protease family protein [Acidobacteria bacterium]|nr:aspartyl protease family protein [Acidobacteriota bacterium]
MVRLGLILWFLPAFCLAADQRDADLKLLFDTRQWFELRDAVEGTDAPAFYRGVVSCVFDDVRGAEKSFRSVIQLNPRSDESFHAHGLLASAHMRAGHYRRALSQLQAMQAINPGFGGLSGAVALFRALSRWPQPAVARRRFSEVRLSDDMFIPVSVNGKPANYGFDSGMDLSVMSEAEARRLNLTIHDVAGSEFHDGASGNQVGIRFAIANRLVLGSFDLRNVTFLVVRNDAMPFVELPAEKQGIIGFPVLRAFGAVRWDTNGVLQIGFRPDPRIQKPNLCVPENSSPLVEGRVGSRKISVVLDTGSGRTFLTPRFARDFASVIEQTGKKDSTRLRGLGGSTEVEVLSLPEFRFHAGEFELVLRPAQVLPQDSRVDRNSYHVWLGMDVLGQARRVTLDFESRRFALE